MGNFLKKNWFVALVIVIFACISVYYIYDTNKGKLKGKTANGEDVVYSINDTDITASQFYDKLYTTNGSSAVLSLFEKAVADASFKTTNDLKDQAATQADTIRSNYAASYGSSYESELATAVAATGYESLEDYLLTQLKLNNVAGEYAANHFDELKIREISYILIQFEDSENVPETPTEDEQSRMDAVDKMLADGSSFADTAAEYSEDTSTSANGGVLGVIDVNTSTLDKTFQETALSLSEGEVSDWVKSDEFGYFKIMCNAATPETLESSENIADPYVSLVTTYDTTLLNSAIWEKAQTLGIDFKGNTDLENEVRAALGVEDVTTEPESTAAPETTASPASTAEAESTPSASADSEGGNE